MALGRAVRCGRLCFLAAYLVTDLIQVAGVIFQEEAPVLEAEEALEDLEVEASVVEVPAEAGRFIICDFRLSLIPYTLIPYTHIPYTPPYTPTHIP